MLQTPIQVIQALSHARGFHVDVWTQATPLPITHIPKVRRTRDLVVDIFLRLPQFQRVDVGLLAREMFVFTL